MAERVPPGGTDDRRQFADYVAELTGELAALSRRQRFDALGYLLEMTQLEAKNATLLPKKPATKTKLAQL